MAEVDASQVVVLCELFSQTFKKPESESSQLETISPSYTT